MTRFASFEGRTNTGSVIIAGLGSPLDRFAVPSFSKGKTVPLVWP